VGDFGFEPLIAGDDSDAKDVGLGGLDEHEYRLLVGTAGPAASWSMMTLRLGSSAAWLRQVMSARVAANKAILLDFIVLSGIWKTEKCINCGAKARFFWRSEVTAKAVTSQGIS